MTLCQISRTRPIAITGGSTGPTTRRHVDRAAGPVAVSTSSPRSSESRVASAVPFESRPRPGPDSSPPRWTVRSTGMAADLLAQPVGDLHGERGDLGRLDPARAGDANR